jgi:hypothetical protein
MPAQTALRARALSGHIDPTSSRRLIPRGAVLAPDDPAVKAQPHLFLIAENVDDVAYNEARRAYGARLAEQAAERDRKQAAAAEKEQRAARAKIAKAADKQQPSFIAKLAAGRVAGRERVEAEAEHAATASDRRALRTAERREQEAAAAELRRRLAAGELDAELEHAEAELAADKSGTGKAVA